MSRSAWSTATSSSTEPASASSGADSGSVSESVKGSPGGLGLAAVLQEPGGATEAAAPTAGRRIAEVEPDQPLHVPRPPVVDDQPEGLLKHPFLTLRPLVQAETVRLVGAPAELRDPDRCALVAVASHHPPDPPDLAAHLGDLGCVGIDGHRLERGLDLVSRVEPVQELLVRRL